MVNYKFIWESDDFEGENKKACFRLNDNNYLIEDVLHLDELLPHLLKYTYSTPALMKDIRKLYEYYGMQPHYMSDEILQILENDPLKKLAPDYEILKQFFKNPNSFASYNIEQSKIIQNLFLNTIKKKPDEQAYYKKDFCKLLTKFDKGFFEQNLDHKNIQELIWKSTCSKPEVFLCLTKNKKLPINISGLNLDENGFVPHPIVWQFLFNNYKSTEKCHLLGAYDTLLNHFIKQFNTILQYHGSLSSLESKNKNLSEKMAINTFHSNGNLYYLDPQTQQKIYKEININQYLNIFIDNAKTKDLVSNVEKFTNFLMSNPSRTDLTGEVLTMALFTGLNFRAIVDTQGVDIKNIIKILKDNQEDYLVNVMVSAFSGYVRKTITVNGNSDLINEKLQKIAVEIEKNILSQDLTQKPNKTLKL